MAPDNELISAYSQKQSEAAFQALVSRHIDLVFATAMRQVGDRGLAEEITQNVFITLARKAPALRGMETLAGWLHRTAILESKARIRSELRRKRREETAATLQEIAADGDSTVAALLPLVDEALLHLPEVDRIALVLRYLEDRSLREVGEALGTNEDAARKRVSRALDRAIEFFKKRGFVVPLGIVTTALTTNTKATPAGLTATVTKAAIAATATRGVLQLLYLLFMGLSKTQTLLVCGVLAVAPLVWQERAIATVRAEQSDLTARLAIAREKSTEVDRRLQQAQRTLVRAKEQLENAELQVAALAALSTSKATVPQYVWDDNSPFIRVPKQYLMGLPIGGSQDSSGQLSSAIIEALQLTETERRNVQDAIDQFFTDYNAALAAYTREVSDTAKYKRNDKDVRVFEVKASAVEEQAKLLIKNWQEQTESLIGSQRAMGLIASFDDRIAIGKEQTGLSSSLSIVAFDHFLVLQKPEPGDSVIIREMRKANGEMVSAPMSIEALPLHIKSRLQDWIAVAQSKPVKSNQ